MSNQILQAGRALAVIPSDNARIPSPAVVASGINNEIPLFNQLVDVNVNFISANVAVGDVVYNITEQTAATVVEILSANFILLNADIFPNLDCQYIIYQQSPQTGSGNQGCVLYVGGTGNISLITTGQDNVIFTGVNVGSFIPVHVLQINSTDTTATNILALW